MMTQFEYFIYQASETFYARHKKKVFPSTRLRVVSLQQPGPEQASAKNPFLGTHLVALEMPIGALLITGAAN